MCDGLDPDEYIAKYGKEKFEEVLDRAQDLMAFHTQLQLDLYPQPLDAQAKTAIVTELVDTLLRQPDPIVRREWAKYIAERVEVDEALVLGRLRGKEYAAVRAKQRFGKLHLPAAQAEAPQAAETFNAAEENLTAWLLRYPQYAAGCGALAQQFDSRALGAVLEAVCKAYGENPAPEGFLDRVQALAPARGKLVIRLSMAELPADFQPQRDIEDVKKAVEKEVLQRQLADIRQQIKTAPAGQVPAGLLKQMTDLQNKLKN